jgi:hypothetical protein
VACKPTIWQSVTPIAQTALRVVAPVVLILGGLIVAAYLARRGATPFNLARVTSDPPSFLAVLIILTICSLPLSELDVPSVLNNIALVVVGFYLGKHDTSGGTVLEYWARDREAKSGEEHGEFSRHAVPLRVERRYACSLSTWRFAASFGEHFTTCRCRCSVLN